MKNAFLVGLAMLVFGCAQTSTALKDIESALSVVRSAQAAGAAQNTAAAPKLAQAESEVTNARSLLEGGNTAGATTSAQTAEKYAQEALQLVQANPQATVAAPVPAAPATTP